jgi:hypothetical protein
VAGPGGSGSGEAWREGAIEGGEVRSCSGGARAAQDGGIGPVVVTLVLGRRDREQLHGVIDLGRRSVSPVSRG